MKIKADVPVTNVKNKALGMELDTDTGEVGITLPATMKTPRVALGALKSALAELDRASTVGPSSDIPARY